MKMAKVRLEGISRNFADVAAVEDISFEVPDGQFWVLVGPSGCGKSTILRMIAGLEGATAGNLYIGETLVNDLPARQRDVAMVFQNYALYPHMTVGENLSFGLRMRNLDWSTIQQRVEVVARSLDILALLDRKPKQLSGGQQQRVALGRAIARQPQVFLLDEPLSNLDAQLRDDTRVLLKQLHQQVGITTIYVTHDQVEAMTLADQIVVLQSGRIQQIGTPQEIYRQPANRMVAAFLGNPPMNVLPATFTAQGFLVGGQVLPCPTALQNHLQLTEGQMIDLGIRPEHLVMGAVSHNLQLMIEVKVVEPLGREVLVRGTLPDSDLSLNVIAGSDWQGGVGDYFHVQLKDQSLANQEASPDSPVGSLQQSSSLERRTDQLFVFDPTTGKTLYP
jgi:multiple sugar transport system ATP-binding protein